MTETGPYFRLPKHWWEGDGRTEPADSPRVCIMHPCRAPVKPGALFCSEACAQRYAAAEADLYENPEEKP